MENVEAFLPVEVTIQEMESYDGAPGDTWFLGPPGHEWCLFLYIVNVEMYLCITILCTRDCSKTCENSEDLDCTSDQLALLEVWGQQNSPLV